MAGRVVAGVALGLVAASVVVGAGDRVPAAGFLMAAEGDASSGEDTMVCAAAGFETSVDTHLSVWAAAKRAQEEPPFVSAVFVGAWCAFSESGPAWDVSGELLGSAAGGAARDGAAVAASRAGPAGLPWWWCSSVAKESGAGDMEAAVVVVVVLMLAIDLVRNRRQSFSMK